MKLELWFPCRDEANRFFVTQYFGVNGDYYQANGINIIGHNGLDCLVGDGKPVYAAHDGIAYTGKDSREGLGVTIITTEQRELLDGTQAFIKTIYWHLKSWNIKDGQEVKVGDVIGYADNTGFSTGTHLHFGLKPVAKTGEQPWQWGNLEQNNGYYGCIDPLPFFNGFYADHAQAQLTIMRVIIELLKKVVELLLKA